MANDAIYPLPDPVYRRIVKARAVAVYSGMAQSIRL